MFYLVHHLENEPLAKKEATPFYGADEDEQVCVNIVTTHLWFFIHWK